MGKFYQRKQKKSEEDLKTLGLDQLTQLAFEWARISQSDDSGKVVDFLSSHIEQVLNTAIRLTLLVDREKDCISALNRGITAVMKKTKQTGKDLESIGKGGDFLKTYQSYVSQMVGILAFSIGYADAAIKTSDEEERQNYGQRTLASSLGFKSVEQMNKAMKKIKAGDVLGDIENLIN